MNRIRPFPAERKCAKIRHGVRSQVVLDDGTEAKKKTRTYSNYDFFYFLQDVYSANFKSKTITVFHKKNDDERNRFSVGDDSSLRADKKLNSPP